MGGEMLNRPGSRTPAVDSRILEAIIRAVYNYDSFVMRYDWIEDELKAVVRDEVEYKTLAERMYELISDGEIKNVRIIYRHVDSIGDSVVAVSPCTLAKEQWEELEDLADMYDYAGYEDPCAYKCDFVVKRDRPSLDIVLHNSIRAWCIMLYGDVNALAVYNMFKERYGLEKSYKEIVGI
jgi:hypothetical protein